MIPAKLVAENLPLIAMLAGSLVAIPLLAALARWLGLGGDVRLSSEAEACELAAAAVCGFAPVEVALDRAGIGALLRDAGGRTVLLRRHGVHFIARALTSSAAIRLDRHFLVIGPDEPFLDPLTLDLGPAAQVWAGSLRRLR